MRKTVISKKKRTGRKTAVKPLAAGKKAQVQDMAEKTLAARKAVMNAGEQAAFSRPETAGRRSQAGNLRQGATDLREDTASANARFSAKTQVQLQEVNERLVVATIHAQAMTEAAELAIEQMAHMAQHDFLTGLPNRALLLDRLGQSMALAKRNGKKVALLYLDLDHFKHINDSLGHAIGDKLLQSAAKRLQTCVRLSDTVSRQGGDEFVVLLPDVDDAQDVVITAKKVIAAMTRFHLISGHRLRVTSSIGISLYPDDGSDIDALVRNADTAMYHAKKTGRNTYQVFKAEMNVRAVARQTIEQALNRALEEHKFVLHYQPKINLETGAITGAEALIRIQESFNQLVCPEHFISIAEECNLIRPIGRWALQEACRQTKAWRDAGLPLGQIAVNVSFREFHHKDFLSGVIHILNATGLDPRHLELEMTESGLMQDSEPTTTILLALKKLGVQLALDDFGTGYSSLSYLLRFPIDTIKIDRSFVRKLDDDTGASGAAIVRAVIAMGASLKKRVVAEGIETQQQLAFLQTHQCSEGQGYYFSQPVPAEEFHHFCT